MDIKFYFNEIRECVIRHLDYKHTCEDMCTNQLLFDSRNGEYLSNTTSMNEAVINQIILNFFQ